MSRIPLIIATIMLMTTLAPSVSSDDGKIHLAPLPLGPDTDRFFFSTPIETEPPNTCKTDVNTAAGLTGTAGSAFQMFGTNNEADPCRAKADSQNVGAHRSSMLVNQGTGQTHTVFIVPATEEITLDTSKKIEGKLVIEADGVSAFKPTITVQNVTKKADGTDHVGEVGKWSADALQGPEVTAGAPNTYPNKHFFSFEITAPEQIVGKIRVSIDLRRTAAADGVRAVSGIGYRIGVYAADPSYIDIPIAAVAGGEAPETVTCPDGSEAANLTACPEDNGTTGPDNSTVEPGPTDAPETNNTTTEPQADNNTTAKPKDKGIPGFGAVAVVSAGFMVAFVLRRRRD